jgi:phospholipase A1
MAYLPAAKNDNPDIAEFIGRGDEYNLYKKQNIVSFIGTHNLNFNSKSRGSAMFSWSYHKI